MGSYGETFGYDDIAHDLEQRSVPHEIVRDELGVAPVVVEALFQAMNILATDLGAPPAYPSHFLHLLADGFPSFHMAYEWPSDNYGPHRTSYR